MKKDRVGKVISVLFLLIISMMGLLLLITSTPQIGSYVRYMMKVPPVYEINYNSTLNNQITIVYGNKISSSEKVLYLYNVVEGRFEEVSTSDYKLMQLDKFSNGLEVDKYDNSQYIENKLKVAGIE